MKIPVALKLDFKIDEKGKLKIFDIGDGLGAGKDGFKDIPISATILRDLQEANNSTLATVFGELPIDAMQPETIHLPILQRNISPEQSSIDTCDLSESGAPALLPYSQAGRLQSYVSNFWAKKLDSVVATPIALMGIEMHKIMWYALMQKHMAPTDRDAILYWSNDNPTVKGDLSTLNMTNGVFIKIADRSIGGGSDVYYAKNAVEVTKTLNQLHHKYQSSRGQPHIKHIFVIEPAYQTIKSYQNENYNVTGRAFVTLIFDPETRELQVKVAGAKWMFPKQPLQKIKTQEQMLSNIEHTIGLMPLDNEESNILSQQIVDVYGDVFKAAIEHDDLMQYCEDHPITAEFCSILRHNATYKMIVDCNKPAFRDDHAYQDEVLTQNINSLVFRDHLSIDIPTLLASEHDHHFFSKNSTTKPLLMKQICYLSFLEGYAKFIKTCGEPFITLPNIIPLLKHESLIRSKLDTLIKQFLRIKSTTYDLQDMNRALRQAASISDIEVLKLLIGTHRASINNRSPQTQQTALDFATKNKCEPHIKELCIQFLKQSGAELQPQTTVEPAIANSL